MRSRAISAAAWLVGLPWRLGAERAQLLSPSDPRLKRVVVIKPCCMGDVLMSTAAVSALREALPQAHISLVVGKWSRPAVANNPRLDRLIDFPEQLDWGSYWQMARQIRRGRYGAALVLDRSPLLNALPLLAGVHVRAGLDSEYRGIGLTHSVTCPPSRARHEVQWYLDVLRALGLPASKLTRLEFYPTESDRAEAGRVLAEVEDEGGYVALHLGGGTNPGMQLLSKRWQPEYWARIADWLTETYQPNILLLGGPGKEDRQAAEAMKAALFPGTTDYVVDLVGRLSWGELGAVLERCSLFLGHDTGAMHLATAVGTPVVAVFGPSDPARYGPWDPSGRSRAVGMRRRTTGAESLRRAARQAKPYHSAVSPEQVWRAMEKVYPPELDDEA